MRSLFVALICAVSLAPFSADASQGNWAGEIEPRTARDLNPDPNIVEIVIVAYEKNIRFSKGGKKTKAWTYNGGVPGPTIDANVGDTLVVHFFNLLPEESTIHWHGLELPADMDGSHIAQNPVPQGGYFKYEFKLLRASTFWYHPHVRSNEQVEKGLYGAMVVHDPEQDSELGLPSNESVVVLDDVLLTNDGSIASPFPTDPLENAVVQANGREGNKLLVNGRTDAKGRIRYGVPHRMRLINASNARFMRVSIPGHRMWRIGGDSGLLESPIEALPIEMVHAPGGHGGHGMNMISDPDLSKGIILTPGERADVVFTPMARNITVEWHDHAKGRHTASYDESGNIALGHAHDDGTSPPQKLLQLRTYGLSTSAPEYIPPATLDDIDPIDVTTAAPMMVMFGHTNPDSNGDITFFSQMKNGMPLPFAMVTPDDAPSVNVGDRRIIEVHNMTGGDHNFHLHGFVFQHLETQYMDMDTPENNRIVPADRLENKDTIFLPKRTGQKGRSRSITRLALHVSDEGREGQIAASGKVPGENTSGGWLFHCHILEHSARGMMSFLQVTE